MIKRFILSVICLLIAVTSYADTAKQVDFLLAGYRHPTTDEVLSGGKVWTFLDNTSTMSALYTDKDQGGTATNPITLDTSGKAEVYGNNIYKLVIYDATGAIIETINGCEYVPIADAGDVGGGTIGTVSELLAISAAPDDNDTLIILGYNSIGDGGGQPVYWDAVSTATHNGFNVFKSTTINPGRWLSVNPDILTIKNAGAVGDDSTGNTTVLQGLIDLAGTTPTTYLVHDGIFISGRLTIADDQNITFDGGNKSGTLKKRDTTNDYLIYNESTGTMEHFGLKNIIIDGNKDNQTIFANTISVNVNTANITGSEFKNCDGESLKLAHVTTSASVVGNYFHDGAEHTGVANEGSTYLSVRTNILKTITEGQILTIQDNLFRGFIPSVVGRGIGGIILTGSSASLEFEAIRATITGNTLIDVGQDESTVANRIAAINLYRRAGLSIITENRIIGGQHKGIDVQGSPNCVVTSNVLQDQYPGDTDAAIDITARDATPIGKISDGCIVHDNVIDGWGVGIVASYANTDPGDGISIQGNTIKNVIYFISLIDIGGNINVSNNVLENSTGVDTDVRRQGVSIIVNTLTALREATVTFNNNTMTDVANMGFYMQFADGPTTINGNTFNNVIETMVTVQACRRNLNINSNAMFDTGNKFVNVGSHDGAVSINGNTFIDAIVNRSLQLKDLPANSMTTVSNNIFQFALPTEMINYDTCLGRNMLTGNVSLSGTTVNLTGGSVITNVNNLF